MNQQFLNFLGLAMRAGKVKSGETALLSELKKHNLKLVLIAKDASEQTQRQMIQKCNALQIPYRLISNRVELGHALGKNARVHIGITDQGFARKLISMIDD